MLLEPHITLRSHFFCDLNFEAQSNKCLSAETCFKVRPVLNYITYFGCHITLAFVLSNFQWFVGFEMMKQKLNTSSPTCYCVVIMLSNWIIVDTRHSCCGNNMPCLIPLERLLFWFLLLFIARRDYLCIFGCSCRCDINVNLWILKPSIPEN